MTGKILAKQSKRYCANFSAKATTVWPIPACGVWHCALCLLHLNKAGDIPILEIELDKANARCFTVVQQLHCSMVHDMTPGGEHIVRSHL